MMERLVVFVFLLVALVADASKLRGEQSQQQQQQQGMDRHSFEILKQRAHTLRS